MTLMATAKEFINKNLSEDAATDSNLDNEIALAQLLFAAYLHFSCSNQTAAQKLLFASREVVGYIDLMAITRQYNLRGQCNEIADRLHPLMSNFFQSLVHTIR